MGAGTSSSSNGGFHFHTGRRLAALLGYDPALLEKNARAFEVAGHPLLARKPS